MTTPASTEPRALRRGVRIALDVGTARIGVAACDPDGILASPVCTVRRRPDDTSYLGELLDVISERAPLELLVGLPVALSGRATASTDDAIAVARQVAARTTVPIRLVDERLTTVSATAALRASGKQASRSRDRIDQVAAVVILEHALDTERRSGKPAGTPLDTAEER